MTLKLKALIAASLATLVPATAFAAISVGDSVGNNLDAIRASLESAGYVVEELEDEGDGEVEAGVTMDGMEFELVIDLASGQVIEVENEEDGDDDEEDDD